jgi:hypothetical protein
VISYERGKDDDIEITTNHISVVRILKLIPGKNRQINIGIYPI